MAYDDIASRKELTFAQAEGQVPLPSQLLRSAMPATLRARLWDVLHSHLISSKRSLGINDFLSSNWEVILRREHIERRGAMPENFSNRLAKQLPILSQLFSKDKHVDVYDFMQFLLRHPKCPQSYAQAINVVLAQERAAYRIVEGDTFLPIGSQAELQAIAGALADALKSEAHGAHSHLRGAATALSAGDFAGSVRESIHAVEAVARTLEPSAELSKALSRLEVSKGMHGAMKKGFLALYGYASDEQGIRHPLLDGGAANVDEVDAIFMIGACASFVTYLLNKERAASAHAPQGS